MSKFTDFFKSLSAKDWAIIGLVLGIILMIMTSAICLHKYQDAKHDVVIWNDSAYIYKNKYNEEYAAKNTYIMKASQLKYYNSVLYQEYMSLKNNPIVVTKTKLVTKIDTIITNTDSVKLAETEISWVWSAKDSTFYMINGESRTKMNGEEAVTQINSLMINSGLYLDVIDNGKQLSVIAKSDNPYMNVSDIQSVVIDPTTSPTLKNYFKPKRWGFGPTISAGLLFGCDFHGQPIIGAGGLIGFSIHYDIWQW